MKSSKWFGRGIACAMLVAAGAILSSPFASAEEGISIPPPALDEKSTATTETAIFAGGCFWGVQGVFQHVEGVLDATSGYAGGEEKTAIYEVVGGGNTGHAEAVKVTFDPKKVTYGKLLQVYFSVAHDPTQLNRQGPDSGTQYRSTVFPIGAEQTKVAKAYIDQLDAAKVYGDKIATTIEPEKTFYAAEGYHQNFLTLNPDYPYIVYNDLPKIENLKKIFPDMYRKDPVLVKVSG
ncbi:peptide-methionine (S)-S-oxide reductase MsrA [Rhizobium sp. TH2]|nr:peptide-methionine (S)-S-oxide reductase MsrA [Rhizobium sp. TH2]